MKWAEWNRPHKVEVEDGGVAPDANEEYLLYQTLVGAWPGGDVTAEFRDRIKQYMRKALAEAKVHTSWINPDAEYEAAVATFLDHILDPAAPAEFLADLSAFAVRVAFFGRVNSLAQTLVRCTAPGVPDTYQGTESWDLSLVDPDNRRPVDYNARARWLREIDERAATGKRGLCRLALELARQTDDPRTKQFVTTMALRCRREHPDLFAGGEYVPLTAAGERTGHVFAFLRRTGDSAAVVIVPRLPVGLVPDADRVPIGQWVWGDTVVPLPEEFARGEWKNVFTGETVEAISGRLAVAEALRVFPVALLVRG